MNKTLNAAYAIESTPVQLTERDAACITNGRGSVVRVERGSVWMTQDGCTDDTVLGIGESYRITSNALTVATLLGRDSCAVITLGPAERAIREARPGWLRGVRPAGSGIA